MFVVYGLVAMAVLTLYRLQSLRICAIEFDARRSVNGDVG